jgi:hypothetical protein
VLHLGMWHKCFARSRGSAGANLDGLGACRQALHAPAPPRALTGAAPGLGGRAMGAGSQRDARRAPHPARRAGGWLAGRGCAPALPRRAGRRGAPLPWASRRQLQAPPEAAAGGRGGRGG